MFSIYDFENAPNSYMWWLHIHTYTASYLYCSVERHPELWICFEAACVVNTNSVLKIFIYGVVTLQIIANIGYTKIFNVFAYNYRILILDLNKKKPN